MICHNPDAAARDAAVRDRIIARLDQRITGSDTLPARKRAELAGALRTKPAFVQFLRTTPCGLLRIDPTKVRADANFDGKFLLRTSDESLTAADIATGYKGLYEAERGWRDLKSTIDLRPVYHHREDRIRAHIQLQWPPTRHAQTAWSTADSGRSCSYILRKSGAGSHYMLCRLVGLSRRG